MLNKTYKVVNLTPALRICGIGVGDVVTVNDIHDKSGEPLGMVGATKVWNNSKGQGIDVDHINEILQFSHLWCIFTDHMVESGMLICIDNGLNIHDNTSMNILGLSCDA